MNINNSLLNKYIESYDSNIIINDFLDLYYYTKKIFPTRLETSISLNNYNNLNLCIDPWNFDKNTFHNKTKILDYNIHIINFFSKYVDDSVLKKIKIFSMFYHDILSSSINIDKNKISFNLYYTRKYIPWDKTKIILLSRMMWIKNNITITKDNFIALNFWKGAINSFKVYNMYEYNSKINYIFNNEQLFIEYPFMENINKHFRLEILNRYMKNNSMSNKQILHFNNKNTILSINEIKKLIRKGFNKRLLLMKFNKLIMVCIKSKGIWELYFNLDDNLTLYR